MNLFTENRNFVFKAFVVMVFGIILVKGADLNDNNEYKNDNTNVISVTGKGEVNAVPDIASVSFDISKEAKTVKEAQDQVSKVEGEVLSSLKTNGIEDKDIKTTNSSFYPKYEYTNTLCRGYVCPPGKSEIVGYTVSETITVKIRNTDNAGKVIADLGALGVSSLSGPNFTIDDEEGLKAEARKKAIEDARAKAEVLAKDLGVNLGKITSFSENSNNGIYPYYAKTTLESFDTASSAPTLPKGENTITSEVTITYKIK